MKKILRVIDIKDAIKDLPDDAEVLIQTDNILYNITGTKVSFFNRRDNKHIKLLSDLITSTLVEKEEYELDKKRLKAFDEAVVVLRGI